MIVLAYIVVAVYLVSLSYITLYCLMQLHLLWQYKRASYSVNVPTKQAFLMPDTLPKVTIQLPIFNEKYVVERLIDRICSFEYPKNLMEIQVLDDSTDETLAITKNKVAEYSLKGYDIHLLHRKDRSGYKAGALKEATVLAKGSLIAIFDADFLPRTDFLKVTIPYFQDPQIGLVQTRWTHLNEAYSVLTRLQAMQLNVHFTVEQQGRKAGNCLLQFNGTAGIWRRSTIQDAGGWETDTLTEDLDLSYRAQLKGWKIHYLEKFPSPAELPAEMNGLKSQQFRWMKGGAENARKLLPTIWKSQLNFKQKMHASTHLLGSGVFLFVFIAGLVSVPLLYAIPTLGWNIEAFAIFLIGLISISMVYFVANVQAVLEQHSFLRRLIKFFILFPVFLSLSMGLSLHNTIAVLQGYRGKRTPFIRTPKFNIQKMQDSFKRRSYLSKNLKWTTILEGILALYFLVGVYLGIQMGSFGFLLFHLALAIGFGTICYYSIRHLSRP